MRTSTHRIAVTVAACGLLALSVACPSAPAAHATAPAHPDAGRTAVHAPGAGRNPAPAAVPHAPAAHPAADRVGRGAVSGAGALVPALAGALAGDEPLASGTGRVVRIAAPRAAIRSATLTGRPAARGAGVVPAAATGPGEPPAVAGRPDAGRRSGGVPAPAPGATRPVPAV